MNDHPNEPPVTRVTPRSQMYWWQDWKWVAAIACVLAALAIGAWSLASVRTNVAVDRLAALAQQNRVTLERIDRNQAGIDELVAFVHDVQRQQAQQGSADVVNRVLTILCSSSDPTRMAACQQLGIPPAGG